MTISVTVVKLVAVMPVAAVIILLMPIALMNSAYMTAQQARLIILAAVMLSVAFIL